MLRPYVAALLRRRRQPHVPREGPGIPVGLGSRDVHGSREIAAHVERGAAHVEDALHAVDYAHDLGWDADGDTHHHQWSERAAGYAGRTDRRDDAHDHCEDRKSVV